MIRAESMLRAVVILLLIYLFTLGATFNGVLLPDIKPFNMGVIALALLVWGYAHRQGRWQWHTSALDVPLVLWAVVIGVALVLNLEAWRRSVIGLWYISLYALLWYLIADSLANKRLKRDMLADGVLFAGGVLILFGFIQLRSVGGDFNSARPGSLIGNPNSFGAFLVVLIGLGAARAHYTRQRIAKIILTIYTLFALLMLILTFSRGAWLGGGAALFTLFLLIVDWRSPGDVAQSWSKVGKSWRFLSIFAAIVVLIVVLVMGVWVLRSLGESGRTLDLRTRIWSQAVTAMTEKPLFGHGLFTFGQEFERLESMPPRQPHSHAHNLILNFAAEFGLAGLGILGIATAGIGREMVRNWRLVDKSRRGMVAGGIAASVGFGVHHLFDTPLMMPAIALVGLIALSLAIVPIEATPTQSKNRRRVYGAGLAVIGVLVVVSGVWSTLVYRQYSDALLLLNEDDYRGAAEGIQAAIDADPSLAIYHEQQALLYAILASEQGGEADLQRAIAGYEAFLELEPQSAVGMANLAALHWQAGNQVEAIELMQQSVDSAPLSWALWLNLGMFAEDVGDEDLMISAYENALTRSSVMLPFWQETPLRQSLAAEIELTAIDDFLVNDAPIDREQVESVQGNGERLYALARFELAQDAPDMAQITGYIRDLEAWATDDDDRIWLNLAQGEMLAYLGDDDAAAEAFAEARRLAERDLLAEDYVFGANTGYFQYLRFVVPRRFVPGMYYPSLDPLLQRLLDERGT